MMLGFKDYSADTTSSSSLKLVPWPSWEEWETLRVSLFSSSTLSVSSALNRVAAWRSRGCLPLVVEITASIIEIQQKDPYFRVDNGNEDAPDSEDILAMLYCMAIMRLVNGVVEKTRKKTEVSIGEAADTINIPRMLIDIRHECSHRDLPSLRLVRLASIKALDWLKSYYWEPQKMAIQSQSDGATRIKKVINCRLRELAFFLEMKRNAESSSPIKRKGSKKQISKALKNLLRIYLSYSVEVSSVVVDILLKESDSLDFLSLDDGSSNRSQGRFDYWKPVITKLSNKEPGFLLTLIKTVHEMIEIQEGMIRTSGELATLEDTAQVNHLNRLSNLFAWLILILKALKHVRNKSSDGVKEINSEDTKLRKSTLVELLRKSLLVSCSGNSQLKGSTLVLADMVGNYNNNPLVEKLKKLFSLSAPSSKPFDEENHPLNISSEIIFTEQENSINQAAKTLALLKLRKKLNSKATTDRATETTEEIRRWVVVKKWNKCPIGTVLVSDWDDPLDKKEQGLLVGRNLKRKTDNGLNFLNEGSRKKTRENGIDDRKDETCSQGVQGKLMIGGVWKKVEQQELFAIAADIRVLV